MKKLKAFFISIVILLILFMIGFWGINLVMKIIVGHSNEVKVPDLHSLDFDVALSKCKKLKFYLKQEKILHDDTIEKGCIISQTPNPGIMTKKYRTLKVVVSKGPEMVRIPNLVNMDITKAKLFLENTGLFVGKKHYRYSNEVEKGKIISTEPMANELLAKKEKVDLIVSLGKLTVNSDKENKYKELLNRAGE